MDKKSNRNADAGSQFRRAIGSVDPLAQDWIETGRPKPEPVPRQSRADERQVLEEMASAEFDPAALETGEELTYCAPGFQDRQFRKLRRGQFSVEAELDLHGMTTAAAKEEVSRFLEQARDSGRRCVRIVHGKGLGSRHGKPVLKNRLQRWLRQRDEVLAFCSARPVDGGTGAVYVVVKRRG